MRLFLFLIVLGTVVSCSPRATLIRELLSAEKKLKDHTGFLLYDPVTKKDLISYRADHYYTPASNTKIFTLLAALEILGDSIPAFKYVVRNDSLLVWGMSDPSFLYRNTFDSRKAYDFLQKSPQRIFISTTNFQTEAMGAGWAWDDYYYPYSAERSPFPIYGNLELIRKQPDHFRFTPVIFSNHFVKGDTVAEETKFIREIDSNQITFYPGKKNSPVVADEVWEVPFHCSTDVLIEMLSDTLKKQVEEITLPVPPNALVFYSIPADSLYSPMMKNSDNFIAEQLLLMCAGVVSDTLKPEIAIRYVKKNFLADLPDDPQWVDGSGLSRYNLFTPRSIVKLWEKIYRKVPQQRLFSLLAIGGQKGTLKSYDQTNPPFIFGKTGSLSNNHTLSGYILTKRRKVLIFSFMNSNFVAPSRDVRKMMQNMLITIRDNY
jgi:serine-type D-Ala-D-Ala carboxypeptidase/endopeptidase (penicillin-binding protein 4)